MRTANVGGIVPGEGQCPVTGGYTVLMLVRIVT